MITAKNIVFSTDVPRWSTCGADRIPEDLAGRIIEFIAPDAPAEFIDSHKIEHTLQKNEAAFVVAVNLAEQSFYRWRGHERVLTIGAQNFDTYRHAAECKIILNPCFNPVDFNAAPTPPLTDRITIDYTYAPSRIRHTPIARREPHIVAIYFRDPHSPASISDLYRVAAPLVEKHDCRLFVLTGPSTPSDKIDELVMRLTPLRGTQFCLYHEHTYEESGKLLEVIFGRVAAIITTNDTISTLSDAAHTGAPLFVMNGPMAEQNYQKNDPNRHDPNFKLQRALYQQNRLQVLSVKNIRSSWQPYYYDDWADIGARIANLITKQIAKLVYA